MTNYAGSTGPLTQPVSSNHVVGGCSEDAIALIVRCELKRVLEPILEDSLSRSKIRNEALAQDLKDIIEDMTLKISRNATSRGRGRETESKMEEPGDTDSSTKPAQKSKLFDRTVISSTDPQ